MTEQPRQVGEKRAQRSVRWEINLPLLIVSVFAFVLVALIAGGLYWTQSSQLASSVMAKAVAAEQQQDWEEQIRWLGRYRLLYPDDPDGIVSLAIATDEAVELPPANRSDRVERARKNLRDALAALVQSETNPEQKDDLRRRLIGRLLQFGVRYADQAERQIIELNAADDDPEMQRAMALSLLAQVSLESDGKRDPDKFRKEQQFWLWLSQQPLGKVVELAWRSNPDDLTLSAQLIDFCLNRPERFVFGDDKKGGEKAAGDAEKEFDPLALAGEVASHLATMQSDGRAQWILYGYEQITSPEKGIDRLASVAGPALARLQQHAAETKDDSAAGDDSEAIAGNPFLRVLPAVTPGATYVAQWDYELVLRSAVALLSDDASDEDKLTAMERMDQLIKLPDLDVPAPTIESVYLTRGGLLWAAGQPKQAWQLWQEGIGRLGDQSLKLQLANASGLTEKGSTDEATDATEKLAELVQLRTLALAGPAGANISRGQRLVIQKELDAATWTIQLLRGQTALREGQLSQAITLLQTVLDSQFPISDGERVRAAEFVAVAYERSGTWDLAATAYERAINLVPDQNRYRVLAAQAWARAGASDRAFQQWRAVDGDSLQLSFARARAIINEQLAEPPATRDFDDATRAIAQLRALVKRLPDEDATDKANLQAELELLALAIPDRDDGKERDRAIERLAALADKYPNNSELQSVAALSLAAAKLPERSAEALSRLKKVAGEDSFAFQQTLARTAAMHGEVETAIQSLVKHAEAKPADALESLVLAADLAQASKSADQAYQLLERIPADQRTPEILFRLFSLSLAADLSVDDAKLESTLRWEKELQDREGESGTWWRLARATRLLAQRDRLNPNDPKRDRLLRQAESLQAEIRDARPRWGQGHSLEGQIAAQRGELKLAIDALRRGIAGGDRRATTLLLLVAQLTRANRVAEAEAEFSRFERMVDSNSAVTSLAIAIAEKKGDLRQGLHLARTAAEGNPRDPTSWLLLAQAAAIAARSTDEPEARQSLIAEGKQALDNALDASDNSSLAAYQLRIRFQATFFGTDEVRTELQRALESNIKEPVRSIFVGLAYVELKDSESALPVLTRALRIAPKNPDVYLAMSDYYRLVRDDAQSIAMLEKAFEVAPNRIDIRNRLALAIALRDGADVPWKRLDQLLDSELSQSSPNKLLHALILMNRGDEVRQKQSASILRELIRRGDAGTDDATRMLAALERRRWTVAHSSDPKSAEARRSLAEARRLYTLLTRRPDPAAMDLYRFGDLLLRADQTTEVERLADQLDRMTKGSPIALDLRLRLAQQTGQEEKAAQLVKEWTDKAVESGAVLQASAWETAGRTLSQLGFHEQALDWLQQSYKENPDNFRAYVVGLARARKFDRALEICQSHYKESETQKPEAVALMADVIIISGNTNEVPADIEAIFSETLKRFDSQPAVVESIATLRLAQHNYADAVTLYERAESLAPKNVRVLNNLAMALSEISGRESEALPRIQKAIDLYGRSPELLDTQGLALLRNDRITEAVKVLREATVGSDDPRYRFHLLMALMRTGDKIETLAQWAQLDVKKLKESVLTPAERRDLETMQNEFARRRAT